jgi:hypothetical protein
MLRQFSLLKGTSIRAAEGPVGNVCDLYLDRMTWSVKYLVADAQDCLSVRYALIPPATIAQVEWQRRVLQLRIPRDELQASVSLDFARPLYWSGDVLPPEAAEAYLRDACLLMHQRREECNPILTAALRPHGRSQPSLYSAAELATLHADGLDGSLGPLIDLLYEERTWTLRYLLLDTGRLVPDSQVLISTQWIDRVCCELGEVSFFLSRDAIRTELLAQLGLGNGGDQSQYGGARFSAGSQGRSWH